MGPENLKLNEEKTVAKFENEKNGKVLRKKSQSMDERQGIL